ncbi:MULTISPECIES: GIY-YIG nuclease family protein [unclassified Pseudoalteromonas]|uniref:GIY-YIG nuclease family protein n=1 Tax=unclassified Pseudoalteromonas TaxID=194690 RepID=UPI001022E700|nr:GIY-YIG nuclease family protein [Pseudoalteromonas sp. L1]RZF92055.1 GIY-YIG nuclease family protein [Pseudoalteromonas sp. CO302Y]RZG08092.1 GIY-YIG nuclease family protein [Pseudoalteromonas sp. CO133X]WOC27398.1 GIY-YIG nuclease family protein [Pseudoalteromonas sp. N1230-9]
MTTDTIKSLPESIKKRESVDAVWHLYIVQTRLGHWYTGISTDVEKRFAAHEAGKGAKNLKGKGPLTLVYQQKVGTRSEASKLEARVKKLTKIQKKQFVLRTQLPVK